MALFKAYFDSTEISGMAAKEGLILDRLGSDVYGGYMILQSMNGTVPRDIAKYNGIRKVYEIDTNGTVSSFKAYLKLETAIDKEQMREEFGVEMKSVFREKYGIFRKERDFAILEGDGNVYPEQLRSYEWFSKVEPISKVEDTA